MTKVEILRRFAAQNDMFISLSNIVITPTGACTNGTHPTITTRSQ